MKRRILIGIILLTSVYYLQAQQLPQFSHRMLEKLTYNPAVAGSVLHPEIKLRHRSQWLGFTDNYNNPDNPNPTYGDYVGPTDRKSTRLNSSHYS